MKRDDNARQRNHGETFSFLERWSLLEAALHNIAKHLLDLLNRKRLRQLFRYEYKSISGQEPMTNLRNIDFLHFEVVQDVSHRLV
jgi:hypothetical protein